jgi:hypothetical protein
MTPGGICIPYRTTCNSAWQYKFLHRGLPSQAGLFWWTLIKAILAVASYGSSLVRLNGEKQSQQPQRRSSTDQEEQSNRIVYHWGVRIRNKPKKPLMFWQSKRFVACVHFNPRSFMSKVSLTMTRTVIRNPLLLFSTKEYHHLISDYSGTSSNRKATMFGSHYHLSHACPQSIAVIVQQLC